MTDLTKIKKVHFIGIGGIGISAIARMMLLEGKEVSGSDLVKSLVTQELEEFGAKINIGQSLDLVPSDVDLIVYTIAIAEYDPKLFEAMKRMMAPSLSYPEILGQVSSNKYTIAVSGTHGKTTTTAMLAKIFVDAGLDPTVIVGSLLIDQKSNFIAGQGKYFITEACEYKRSFLNLNPQAVIITNIDNDHLDYYKDLADIQSAFVSLVEKIPADGFLVCDKTDPVLAPVLLVAKCKVLDYQSALPLVGSLSMKQPGQHIKKDAAAALAIAQALGISDQKSLSSLVDFSGTWRRFEYKGQTKNGVSVYDDYAHHPTEIKATLKGAKQMAQDKKVFVVFQPHLFSRTKLLINDFASSFSDADLVILPDIYAAREVDDKTISSKDLVDLISQSGQEALYIPDFSKIIEVLQTKAQPGDLIITMGAGNIFKAGEDLLNSKK